MQLEVAQAASERLYPALFQCFAVIISGYIAGRLNVVTKAESKGIATFVGTFALPSLIFLSLAQLDFSIVNWTFLISMLLAKGVVFFGVVIVTILVSKPMNLGQAGMFAIFCTQSNDFALGYPIINAIYEKTHPEYALYLYLMAPISLAILNPFAFVLLEINKQRQNTDQSDNTQNQKQYVIKIKMLLQILKGIVFNPVLVMTVLGIIGNIAFKHKLSIYIEGLLEVYGQAFTASALFLLGLRMVGQVYRLRGPALIVPCVLIMVKLVILPVVMRECVSALNAGDNQTETSSLSTYAFLYGTIPTAPAVFVFSNIYQLEMDLMASSMVICTFLSAPITFLSAQVITLNKDYADQLKKFGFDLSIVSLFAALWIFLVFTVTRKYKRMPHRITFCLNITQILLAISMIWGGPLSTYPPSWQYVAQQGLQIFSTYSCLLWTCMLSVGLLTLESRGPCFVLSLWPVLAFVAWGAPALMVAILLATKPTAGILDTNATDVIRLCLLVFSLTVTSGCLILYMRWRRRGAGSPLSETTSLVDNAEPVSNTSHTQSVSNMGCYGAITATPSPNRNANGCCTNDPSCESGFMNSSSRDLEDIADNDRDCGCKCMHGAGAGGAGAGAGGGGACEYVSALEAAAGRLGLLPAEQSRGRGGQLLRHTVLVIAYNLTMFIGVTYTGWRVLRKEESGVYIEIAFLDVAARAGQPLLLCALFGLRPQEILLPTLTYIRNKWNGADTVKLPPVEELSFETKHVCEQFITHHLARCQDAITKDIRWRMRTHRGVFRGSCLVSWLVSSGLAADQFDAVTYGRHLLDGRLISHLNNTYHFTNSPLLYRFN
ncbi:PREDICTED: integral membrane protein GPR155 [Papilio polytes]|uniref:integral membrane protein GPR155 n=1 Tax=Papilio polytes TaxID=76194 RepID=UPI00067684B9|nr:PREDICTED: integral membrane protein GPR155 [Papilio polytes]